MEMFLITIYFMITICGLDDVTTENESANNAL